MQKRTFQVGILLLLILMTLPAGCLWDNFPWTSPTQRPQGTDGGLQWASAIAQPSAKTVLNTDALLVEADGYSLMPDGRLPANTGRWDLTFASYTRGKKMTITVNNNGEISQGSVTQSGEIFILGNPPGKYPDSITIFQATSGKGVSGTRIIRDPVKCYYDKSRASYVWSIPMTVNNKKEVHLVRWDGVYIEME